MRLNKLISINLWYYEINHICNLQRLPRKTAFISFYSAVWMSKQSSALFWLKSMDYYLNSPKEFDIFWSFLLSFDLFDTTSLIFSNFAISMTKYRIEVTEYLSRIVETEAENENDAVEMVRQMYRSCDLVLDSSDYVETEISVKRWKSRNELHLCRVNCLTLHPLIAHDLERWQILWN